MSNSIQLTPAEELAFQLLRNSPDVLNGITKGRRDISISQLHEFYRSLARSLELAEIKRNKSYITIETIEKE